MAKAGTKAASDVGKAARPTRGATGAKATGAKASKAAQKAPADAAATSGGKKKKKKTILDKEPDAPEEVSFGLAQARAKLEVEQANAGGPARNSRKRRRKRQPLDASILDAVADHLENAPLSDDEDASTADTIAFQGTRTTFGDGDGGEGEDAAPSTGSGAPRKIKSRKVEGNITVQAMTTKPSIKGFAREIHPNVQSFLKDHFYGSRVRRSDGPFQRNKKRLKPATMFVRR